MSGAKHEAKSARDFVDSNDYKGGLAYMQHNIKIAETKEEQDASLLLLWAGYFAFYLGKYKQALEYYDRAVAVDESVKETIHLYQACCQYKLKEYRNAKELCEDKDISAGEGLRNRLLCWVSHRLNDETSLLTYHRKLTDSKVDQLSLAALHFSRTHYQEVQYLREKKILSTEMWCILFRQSISIRSNCLNTKI